MWCWLLLLFFVTGDFSFSSYFFMPPALHLGFSDPWRPKPALSSTLATFACLLLPGLSWALWFWPGVFYPQTFFTLHSVPTFWRICDSDACRNTQPSHGIELYFKQAYACSKSSVKSKNTTKHLEQVLSIVLFLTASAKVYIKVILKQLLTS